MSWQVLSLEVRTSLNIGDTKISRQHVSATTEQATKAKERHATDMRVTGPAAPKLIQAA